MVTEGLADGGASGRPACDGILRTTVTYTHSRLTTCGRNVHTSVVICDVYDGDAILVCHDG